MFCCFSNWCKLGIGNKFCGFWWVVNLNFLLMEEKVYGCNNEERWKNISYS